VCLAVPMKVTRISEQEVTCEALGSTRTARLEPMYEVSPTVGDYVLISHNAVIRTVPEDEALQSIALFEEILAAEAARHD